MLADSNAVMSGQGFSSPVAGAIHCFGANGGMSDGRSDTQCIKIRNVLFWKPGDRKRAETGMTIVTFAFRPRLSRREVAVNGPEQSRPLQSLL